MKKIINLVKRAIITVAGPIIFYMISERYRIGYIFTKYHKKEKTLKNSIFYESRDGWSITDNPYAIFKHLLSDKNSDYLHIWSVQDFEILEPVIKLYKHLPNVKFVKRDSRKYLKYMATCEYLVNNATFQTFFQPHKNQKYINTWHGTPLKKMGFDIPGNPCLSQNVIRNFLTSSYLISPNEHVTKMYTKSYRLDGLYEGKIIEAGYPRIDLTLNTDRGEVIKRLESAHLGLDSTKQNILYAPTWKGKDLAAAKNDVDQIVADMAELEKKVGETYNVLVKVHPYLYDKAIKSADLKKRLVPDYFDTNEILATTDILITDYSSIFFDFLVTDKPILFYTWDLTDYETTRGMDFEIETLPGPSFGCIEDLIDAVINICRVQNDYQDNYEKFKNEFVKYENGQSCLRVVQGVFQEDFTDLAVIECKQPAKEKILIYAGGMLDNGITNSFLNLMDNIDYERYDVSCFMGSSENPMVLNNISKVNKHARLLFKPGIPNYTVFEDYRNKFIHLFGKPKWAKFIYPEKAYRREYARLFGHSTYDYAIDFSGYSFYWAKLILASGARKKTCFMHNDVFADSLRVVDGKKIHQVNLRGLFTIYDQFDKLANVSNGTMALNQKKLVKYVRQDQFVYVPNTINFEKILRMSSRKVRNEDHMLKGSDIKFVTMGRLSPEKGQSNLIKAFAKFHEIHRNSKLLILGQGPLKSELEQLIQALNLQESTFLVGQCENPFNILKRCDCFVLSSHYEGQPLVLLEAMTLEMNIIATDIVANRTVLRDGEYGLLVENSIEGLEEGFNYFAENKSNFDFKKFEYHKYNQMAARRFIEICC